MTASARQVRPLVCGAKHKIFYGITGYDTAGQWCNNALTYFQNNTTTKLFRIIPDVDKGLRIYAQGDVECLSTYNKNCYYNMFNEQQLIDKIKTLSAIVPLVGKTMHTNLYGSTGYDTA